MITYRIVGPRHKIPRAIFSGLAKTFWADMLDPVPRAIVAFDDGEIVGWVRYEITGPRASVEYGLGDQKVVLWAAGTWVEPEYRGQGISHVMWGKLMQRYQPTYVKIRTITLGGRILSAALVRWFPEVSFEIAA